MLEIFLSLFSRISEQRRPDSEKGTPDSGVITLSVAKIKVDLLSCGRAREWET